MAEKMTFKQVERPKPTDEAVRTVVDTTAKSPEEQAAELLFQYLPKLEQEKILEVKTQSFIATPLWQVLLGYVMRASERFELFNPVILEAWRTGVKPNAPRPCKTCGGLFTSPFGDSLYCCAACFFDKLREKGHSENCTIGR